MKSVERDGVDAKNPDLITQLAEAIPVRLVEALYFQLAVVLAVQLLDPVLNSMEKALDAAKESIRRALEPPGPYLSHESGGSFSDLRAKQKVDHNQSAINARKAAGLGIDVRVPSWLSSAGLLAPWAESFGILVYVTFLWNVDWLRPWQDLMPFVTALILVVFMPLLQKFFAEEAGRAHNSLRFNRQDGLSIPARADRARRNWFLAGAMFVSTVVTATIVVRGLIALDAPGWIEPIIIGLLAAVVGYGTAILAYAAVALDGTADSRENDDLSAQGEMFSAEWQTEVDCVQEELDYAESMERHLIEGAFPKVLERVRAQFEGDRAENVYNLLPLVERAKRLVSLRERHGELQAELARVKSDQRPAFSLNS